MTWLPSCTVLMSRELLLRAKYRITVETARQRLFEGGSCPMFVRASTHPESKIYSWEVWAA